MSLLYYSLSFTLPYGLEVSVQTKALSPPSKGFKFACKRTCKRRSKVKVSQKQGPNSPLTNAPVPLMLRARTREICSNDSFLSACTGYALNIGCKSGLGNNECQIECQNLNYPSGSCPNVPLHECNRFGTFVCLCHRQPPVAGKPFKIR